MTEPSVRGANGGVARAAKLTKEQRSAIAVMAAKKRWAKPREITEQELKVGIAQISDGLKEVLVSAAAQIAPQAAPVPQPTPIYIPPPPDPPKAVQKRRKPMVKEFGKAYSRAEKLLEEALKKRSDAVKIIIACNEDIPMYVNVIKSLGGTVDPQAMRAVDIRSLDGASTAQNMNFYQPPQYQQPQTIPSQDVNPIDPALYATNANPVPGLSPAIANAPVVLNKPLGGAIDLGYTPVDEDAGPGLPNMGGGWQ
jgi:hypothetical protein